MKPVKPPRINGRAGPVGTGSGELYSRDQRHRKKCWRRYSEATTLITALADKYKQTQTPRNLSIISPTGLAIAPDRGISPLAQEGLLSSHYASPGTTAAYLILQNKIKIIAYNYPHKVYLHKPLRAAAEISTSLVLLVILASGHLSIHASKAAN